jgi:hypothetical protein
MRMSDRSSEQHFLLEAPKGPWLPGQVEAERLERHRDPELAVLYLVDLAHSAAAQETVDPIATRDAIAGSKEQILGVVARETAGKLRGSLESDRGIPNGGDCAGAATILLAHDGPLVPSVPRTTNEDTA